MHLSTHLADFLTCHQLAFTSGVVAVSGGPDSVALAHLLIELHREGKIARLVIGHVNHQLRGPESDADEEFVRQLANNAGIAFHTTRIDTAALADKEAENLEA